MSGEALNAAAEAIRRLNVGRATVPAGGPTDRMMRDAVTVIGALVDDAARLRSLAALYEQPLNRDSTFTFTGRELAAMLKEEAADA